MADDRELLHGAQDHQPAFRELLQQHAGYLFGVARAMVRSNADAEDLVQETFLGALKGRFRAESSLRTWLVGILVRQANMLRRSRWHRNRPMSLNVENEIGDPVEPSSGTDAKLDLARLLEELSPEHRQVIVLRELQGLSYDEMTEILKVPRGTVESRLHRAREQLRLKWKDKM